MDNRKFEADEKTAVSGQQGIADWLQNKQLLWISALAVLLVIALIIGLIIVPTSSEDEEPQQEVMTSSEAPEPEPSEEPEVILDSDGDGIPDEVEIAGWETEDGTIYHTDPHSADTDSDGLSDLEEAGDVVSGEGLETIYVGITDPTKADSDDDGLDDKTELHGWTTSRGLQFTTDPMNPDSDGDGLPDGVEAGKASENDVGEVVYFSFSDPLSEDTDGDGLSDLEEADSRTDPYFVDTDGDGLPDIREVQVIGTDPTAKRTDGDGFNDSFEDVNREAPLKLDPLFTDEKVSTEEYTLDFWKGMIAGDAQPVDSMAWLAGYLSAAGFSLIPALGWAAGAFADLRDLVVALLQRDWVSGAFSVFGVLPYAGDAAKLTRKVTKFVDHNPKLVAKVGGAIVEHPQLPEKVKVSISKKIWKKWNLLLRHGATQKALIVLQISGRINLDELAQALERAGHIVDKAVPLMADSKAAEEHLERALRKGHEDVQVGVVALTDGCTARCNPVARKSDVVADGTAHEVKVGYTVLTASVQAQIFSDAYLVKKEVVENAHWHFYPSGYTNQLGASKEVLDLLEKKKIKYTIHLPVVK